MFISKQARYGDSNLCKFLDAHLPNRRAIADAWREVVPSAPWSEIAVQADRAHLGQALELRMGLDLGKRPGYMTLLGFLPPDDLRALLEAAGFSRFVNEHLPDTDTSDPILQSWVRTSQPVRSPSDDQMAALAACLDATSMDQLGHKTREQNWAVETQRGFFLQFCDRWRVQTDASEPALSALAHLWTGYLSHGRQAVAGLGERVLLTPELAPGFAVADLVVGRTLVDIKTSSYPVRDMDLWLNQVLAYLLIDRHNLLYLDQIALYLGWQALLLTVSVDDLLRTASTGSTPNLANLREAFADELRADIDDSAFWRMRQRYPVPPEAMT